MESGDGRGEEHDPETWAQQVVGRAQVCEGMTSRWLTGLPPRMLILPPQTLLSPLPPLYLDESHSVARHRHSMPLLLYTIMIFSSLFDFSLSIRPYDNFDRSLRSLFLSLFLENFERERERKGIKHVEESIGEIRWRTALRRRKRFSRNWCERFGENGRNARGVQASRAYVRNQQVGSE